LNCLKIWNFSSLKEKNILSIFKNLNHLEVSKDKYEDDEFILIKNKIKNILEQKLKLKRDNFKLYFRCILFKNIKDIKYLDILRNQLLNHYGYYGICLPYKETKFSWW
jgi:hypothetical protein